MRLAKQSCSWPTACLGQGDVTTSQHGCPAPMCCLVTPEITLFRNYLSTESMGRGKVYEFFSVRLRPAAARAHFAHLCLWHPPFASAAKLRWPSWLRKIICKVIPAKTIFEDEKMGRQRGDRLCIRAMKAFLNESGAV